MIYDFLYKIINRRALLVIYIILFLIIIYFKKYDFLIIINFLKWFCIITFIWLFNIILRKYFINYIIEFNKFVLKYFPILIKLRKELIDIPFILRVILSFFIFIDMFFIYILRLETKNQNIFYFIRLLIYYNIILWISLPFYLINDFYINILFFLEKGMEIKEYIKSRINFLILSIIFILLFNIKWINIIILIWILDIIITAYFYWIYNFYDFIKDIKFSWKRASKILRISFFTASLNYDKIANELIHIKDYRYKVILLFKGILYNVNNEYSEIFINLKFNLFKKIYNFFINEFWNNYYIEYKLMQNIMWIYYDFNNDEEFILYYIHNYIIGYSMDNDSFEEYFLKIDVDELIKDELSKKFYIEIYFLILYILKELQLNNNLLKKFFIIRNKYDLRLNLNFLEEKEIKEFFNQINLIEKKEKKYYSKLDGKWDKFINDDGEAIYQESKIDKINKID